MKKLCVFAVLFIALALPTIAEARPRFFRGGVGIHRPARPFGGFLFQGRLLYRLGLVG